MSPRQIFVTASVGTTLALATLSVWWPATLWGLAVLAVPIFVGFRDMTQRSHALLRNYPLIGHGRYLMEAFRPEINQYFVESNTSGRPFSREQRSLVYQRAKNVLDTLPFGTQDDVNEPGYEWIEHSIAAREATERSPRVTIGGPDCGQPYSASVLNISAMSYGALSAAAIRALNQGAARGGFAHNTGEGGISDHHLQGGDLIWQIGTGYFGARDEAGNFSAERFRGQALAPNVKMIEIKLSQGAKPGHGGILPAEKVTPEIARIRGVPLGRTVVSPPAHRAFATPRELIRFVARLRELSDGKPIGVKLCVGRRHEVLALCKAMLELGTGPDYIAVDGAEGGTGAAPLEFSNRMGTPLVDGLIFVHNALVGFGLRERVRVIASGKVVTGFDVARNLAIGADLCATARGMMFALGCIQARRCNSNDCPTGVATHQPSLTIGLDPANKAVRVANFHRNTVAAFTEIVAASGLERPSDLRPEHVLRRISRSEVRTYAALYEYVSPSALLGATPPASFRELLAAASPETFAARREPEPQDLALAG